jgi:hypothetical protein
MLSSSISGTGSGGSIQQIVMELLVTSPGSTISCTSYVFEGEVRAQEAVLLEERSAHAIERQQYQDLLDLVPVATLMTTPSGVIQRAGKPP